VPGADHRRGRLDDAHGNGRSAGRWTTTTIPIPSGVLVRIATGHTDMRRGTNSLALVSTPGKVEGFRNWATQSGRGDADASPILLAA
jgi:hypothetical protein